MMLSNCSRRTRRQAGFTLIELLIVISVIVIIMLMVIPSATNIIMRANETSAINSLKRLQGAEISYQSTFPSYGYACSLAALGGDPKSGPPTPQAGQVLSGPITTGQLSGYTFSIVNCTKITVNNQDQFTGFELTAVPQKVGQTGHRGFCMDVYGDIKSDPAGGTNCTQAIQ
jgi:type IV pilus assembly protein PilA